MDELMRNYIREIEQALPAFLPEPGEQKAVADAMAYSLLSGGKRIRAVLLLAFFRLYSQSEDVAAAMPFAAAVEMVHAYSLIHDDLPCMDDAATRRGKPSCHAAFGESTALLAGDGLLTLAFETLFNHVNADNFTPGQLLSAGQTLARAAGIAGMVGGQTMDLENDRVSADLDRLRRTDRKKTGALIAAACAIGAILGGAEDGEIAAARLFAEKIGLAFQIVDDMLDCAADPEALGKPVGVDEKTGRQTYVSLLGISACGEAVGQLTDEAILILKQTGKDAAFLVWLARTLATRKY